MKSGSPPPEPHWSYTGATGPEHWGDLSADYAICRTGRRQSPIDVPSEGPDTHEGLGFDYSPAPLRIVRTGRGLRVNVAPGSRLQVGGRRYRLLQFHYHSPSEHTLAGRRYALEAHLVHEGVDGELAVVAVFFEKGAEHGLLNVLQEHLPPMAGDEHTAAGVAVNPLDLIPPRSVFYTYQGSLTTPPCSEGIRWFVLDTPLQVSAEQVADFIRVFGENARPVQPLHSRVVQKGTYGR